MEWTLIFLNCKVTEPLPGEPCLTLSPSNRWSKAAHKHKHKHKVQEVGQMKLTESTNINRNLLHPGSLAAHADNIHPRRGGGRRPQESEHDLRTALKGVKRFATRDTTWDTFFAHGARTEIIARSAQNLLMSIISFPF